MLIKWSQEHAALLENLKEKRESWQNNAYAIKKATDVDFKDLDPSIVINAAPTIQYSIGGPDFDNESSCKNRI